MSDQDGWALTESDPLVFTQLLRDIGVKGLQVDDLYSLDPLTLSSLQPIHALIFLFKWVSPSAGDSKAEQTSEESKNGDAKGGVMVGEEERSGLGVYFANQVINNSCGTIAALNAVMNIPPQKSEYEDESIEHGPELENLKEFGNGMDSMTLGHVLTNSDLLRTTHNSFTSSSPFSISADPRSKEKEDAYHFIAYVPVGGALWELDGLREGAIRHGEVKEGEGEGWTGKAREVIQERIGTYPEGSLMFNLLAVRSAPLPRIKRLLKDPSTPDDLIPDLTTQLTQETDKEHRGQLENGLRRGNLVGMIMGCLKAMGGAKGNEEGKTVLEEATERARAVGKERREKRLGGMDVD